jgi:hypothetical protein
MSKQSANRHKKQNQARSKAVSNTSSTRPAPTTPTAAKANGTVATKPAETTTKLNGTTTKPAQAATKSASPSAKIGTSKSAPPSAKPGTLKRAQRKQQKIQTRREQQREDARSTRNTILVLTSAVVLVGALIGFLVWHNLAGTDTLAQAEQIVDPNYQPIDGVYCDTLEQSIEHIHAHLTIYINGVNTPLVANTGIAPVGVTSTANVTCYYWLHTHDASGVIHIESPTTRPYTLNQFFDIWERFSSSSSPFPTQLLSSSGWIIYVNNKQVNTDFNHLQLHAHDLITIAYNSPGIKPDTTYAWQGL